MESKQADFSALSKVKFEGFTKPELLNYTLENLVNSSTHDKRLTGKRKKFRSYSNHVSNNELGFISLFLFALPSFCFSGTITEKTIDEENKLE